MTIRPDSSSASASAAARPRPGLNEARAAMREVFGFPDFRPGQGEIL